MKVFARVVAVGMALLAHAIAQVSVQVDFDQEQYFANEKLLAAVRITNLSGRSLTLGTNDEWLDFAVESDDGSVVRQLEKVPVRGEFELPNSGRATRRINLAECFDMTQVGRYRVTAFVRIADLDMEVVSPRASVNIVRGTTVWEQTFGVPVSAAGPPGPLEVRRYELVQAMNSKSVQLYVRLSDQSGGKVYKVFSLGPLLTFSRPEGRVDRQGNLHALFQVSARLFTYHVVGPDGEHKIRQTYQYTSSRPRLYTDEKSAVIVVGGYRIVHESDLPPPPPEDSDGSADDKSTEVAPMPATQPVKVDAEGKPIPAGGAEKATEPKKPESTPGTPPAEPSVAKPKP